ncbi:MAG: hypothetical protein WC303_02705 [Candidatus Paceibacterota bacterium]|jgi:hypothetical protein
MIEVDLIIPGYSRDAHKSASLLKEALEEQGRKVVVIDVFKKERTKWLFKKTLLTAEDHTSAVNTAETELEWLKRIKINTIYTHSYGIVSILAPSLDADRYVFIAPPLGKVHYKPLEKIFGFLPGFQELKNGTLQAKLFQELYFLKTSKKEIIFYVSCFDKKADYGDERVNYPAPIFRKMVNIGKIKISYGASHKDYMRDENIIKDIIH